MTNGGGCDIILLQDKRDGLRLLSVVVSGCFVLALLTLPATINIPFRRAYQTIATIK